MTDIEIPDSIKVQVKVSLQREQACGLRAGHHANNNMATSAKLPVKKVVAVTSTIVSSYAYFVYRRHDRRDLSSKEVNHARDVLARISPTSSEGDGIKKSSVASRHLANLNTHGVTIVKETLSSGKRLCSTVLNTSPLLATLLTIVCKSQYNTPTPASLHSAITRMEYQIRKHS